jgi:NitT/TauT family transport system substrate-binding protein
MDKKTAPISLGFDPAIENREGWSRREFLRAATVAGTAGFLGFASEAAAAEPPPETAKIRIGHVGSACTAPQFVAEELLRAEGFSDVQYIKARSVPDRLRAMAAGETDLVQGTILPTVMGLDAGDPIVIIAGVHPGCYELFGIDRIRSIHDLKGKTVAVGALGAGDHAYISIMASYVGLDPRKDITWVTHPPAESMQLLAQGKIDAYIGFPPDPQELRAKKIGHVVVNTTMDRPWSQYFCCMVLGNREFVHKNPVATKRALRAMLKAADICALEPDRAARLIVDKGYTPRYDYALQTLKELPYGKWREYDPEDTVRFCALRLHEAGMIKSSPQKIIANGTDWRFLRELKKEMKA